MQGITYNIRPSNTLVAGPWVGEFGWELFCWQGYIRRLSKLYSNTIILSRTGHEFLYRDFVTEYHNYDAPASKRNMWLGEIDERKVKSIIGNMQNYHLVRPFNIGYAGGVHTTTIIDDKFNQQDFVKYKSDSLDKTVDILIHARNKGVGSDRNWNINNWQALVNLLKNDYSIGIIGTDEAFVLNDTEDFRNIPIGDLVSIINRTRLVIGQSSGPLHLASLCGTPHFVWSENNNWERYNNHWNPFKTPIYFYSKEGWNPRVDTLYREIIKILK